MLKTLMRLVLLACVLAAPPAFAQGVVQQVGPVTPGDFAIWWANGQVYDGGRVNVATGTPPANSGSCAINTQLGGATTGSFKANGSCSGGTFVLTLTNIAPNGWACFAKDLTTPADAVNQTAYSPSSVTFTATAASADLIAFSCTGF